MSENQPKHGAGARPMGKRQLAEVSTTSTATYKGKQVVANDDELPLRVSPAQRRERLQLGQPARLRYREQKRQGQDGKNDA